MAADRAGYGAFLTAQGKFLFDFFMVADGDALVLDTEGDRVDDFFRRLRMYKLRSKIDLSQGGYRAAVVVGAHVDVVDVLVVDVLVVVGEQGVMAESQVLVPS